VSRRLEGKYPCKICGRPAEVAHRRVIPEAMCEPCLMRQASFQTLEASIRRARTEMELAETTAGGDDGLRRLASAIERFAEVVTEYMTAKAHAHPAEERRLLLTARSWAEFTASKYTKLADELMKAAHEAPKFELLRGLAEHQGPPSASLHVVGNEPEK